MIKRLLKCQILALLFVLGTAWAVPSPVAVLKGATNQLLAALEQNKTRLKTRGVIYSIVRKNMIPYIDLNRMSALVVGPNHWRSATSAQKSAFKREFVRMITATYSTALASYNKRDRVMFYPLRGGYAGQTARVRSLVVRHNGQRIPVSYNLLRSSNSWRVYDFSVENVSIVRSFRAQFAGVLSRSGMKGLIQRLIRHNRKRR